MFRFTIRDVLWLTVVVAMGLGWYVNLRFERSSRQAALDEQRRELSTHMDVEMKKLSKWLTPSPNEIP